MAESILLRFLGNGLIDVHGDDAKLEKISLAAEDLAGELRKSPSKALAYVLAAIDPGVDADDPVILEALDALRKRWVTYVNTFSGPPVAVARAMLLEGLIQTAADDAAVGAAVVALARNALSVLGPDGDTMLWADVIAEIEKDVDARAEAEWAVPSSVLASTTDLEIPEFAPPKMIAGHADVDQLKAGFRAAAGPQYQHPQQGAVATHGNPHWPQPAPQWVSEFSDRMAASVADALDTAVGEVRLENVDVSEPLRSLAAGASSYVREALSAVATASAGLQRRVALLWWKESLFSPTGRISYRGLTPAAAATLMAFDLHQQVPASSPASVAAFLSEAVISLPSVDREETHTVRDLVTLAQTEAVLEVPRAEGALMTTAPEGRGPVLALIAHPDTPASRDEDEFRRLTGVPLDARLTLPEWACWVFRELQAVSAATAATRAKTGSGRRRTRKG